MSITIKNAEEIQGMRAACQAAAQILDFLTPHVKPGVTTAELDRLCLDYLTHELRVKSATIGYAPPGYPPFPASICTSVNQVVCHGIPNEKPLKSGDALNIDVTIIKDGWHGDTSRMYLVGDAKLQARKLSQVAFESMWLGIQQVRPGAHLGDIGHAIQQYAESFGYSVVREFCGHGIGRGFHEEPMVLHYGSPGTGVALQPGMTFTIEPMINAGRKELKTLADGWTVVTKDRSLSAQWEHTVLVTDTGHEVLTVSPGMPAAPAFIQSASPA